MRITFVVAATFSSLLAWSAAAQAPVGGTDTQVPPTGGISAPVEPSVAKPQPAAVAAVRRPVARWYRWHRVRARVPAPPPVHKLHVLTLPSFDMTAPFTNRNGEFLVVPPEGGTGGAIPAPAEPISPGAPVIPVQATGLAPASVSADATPPGPVAQPIAPVDAERGPASSISAHAYTWIRPVAGTPDPTILLPVSPDVGLAAVRVGPDFLVVLDAPIDFRAPVVGLDPAFAQLDSRRTEDATVIRIPMADGTLHLARSARGWLVARGSQAADVASIVPRLIKSGSITAGVRFLASEPSRVVTVLNPLTGARLLVGTQGATGQAVTNPWQQAKFNLLPTLQGVVIGATSDDIRLRSEADGFMLSNGAQADSSIIQQANRQDSNAPIAGALSRLFDIPNGSAADLAKELDQRIRAASSAHALARSEPRLRVAEAMLALGMDVEAQSVLDVATSEDPALLDAPRAIGLRAVASVLAGRFDAAGPLADPRLNGSTEIELWRGFLQAANDDATAADARRLADGLPLVLAYPQTLRDRLLPLTLETMERNGQGAAAQAALRSFPDDRALDFARGLASEADGQTQAALQAYDRVGNGSDRLQAYKARVQATELRIKTGELDARAGADALDRLLYGWRGPRQELALRARIAALRRQAGQWREALAVLRDGRDAFPEDPALMDRELAATFTAFISDPSVKTLSPSEFVALYDQNADLVRTMTWTEQSGLGLVDRLIGLGLQGRAEPILMRLVAQSADPAQRARLGARLADLRMTMDEPAAAIAALAETAPPADATIAAATMEARQLLYAHAESERGNKDAALAMLGTLGTARADAARAEIYAGRKEWPKAVSALTAWEQKAVSGANLTDHQQAMLMRLVVAAALSSDAPTLQRVAATYGATMAKSHSAALFRVLTSPPVQQEADLPRAFEDIQQTRQLLDNLHETESP